MNAERNIRIHTQGSRSVVLVLIVRFDVGLLFTMVVIPNCLYCFITD